MEKWREELWHGAVGNRERQSDSCVTELIFQTIIRENNSLFNLPAFNFSSWNSGVDNCLFFVIFCSPALCSVSAVNVIWDIDYISASSNYQEFLLKKVWRQKVSVGRGQSGAVSFNNKTNWGGGAELSFRDVLKIIIFNQSSPASLSSPNKVFLDLTSKLQEFNNFK